jgi:hypothetical protein
MRLIAFEWRQRATGLEVEFDKLKTRKRANSAGQSTVSNKTSCRLVVQITVPKIVAVEGCGRSPTISVCTDSELGRNCW